MSHVSPQETHAAAHFKGPNDGAVIVAGADTNETSTHINEQSKKINEGSVLPCSVLSPFPPTLFCSVLFCSPALRVGGAGFDP